jgi:hypothetical protein
MYLIWDAFYDAFEIELFKPDAPSRHDMVYMMILVIDVSELWFIRLI